MLFKLLRCSYNLEFLHDSEALDLSFSSTQVEIFPCDMSPL